MDGIKILSDVTVWSKYSKYIPSLKRRETWEELINRYLDMMIKKYPTLSSEIIEKGQYIIDKKVLPSMRALQFAGKAIEVNEARAFNCSYHPVEDYRSFSETMFLLLSGCGVGYSVQKHHVEKLPPIHKPTKRRKFVIDDSIIGWADAVKILMKSYLGYTNSLPIFDYSEIRPKGARLVTAGGKAPGPEPLKECIFKVEQILDRKKEGDKLTSLDCHDILCHIANAVLAGGIRRCLPYYAEVHTKNGLKQIKDVEVGEMVLTYEGYKPVLNNFYQGKQDTIIINTQLGEFECTPNHKVAVVDTLDSYKWVEAQHLTSEDRLLFIPTEVEGQVTSLPKFHYSKPKHSTTCKDITIPELTPEVAYLFGIIFGDGYVFINKTDRKTPTSSIARRGKVSVACSNNYEHIKPKVINAFRLFGIEPKVKKGDGDLENITAYSYQLALYFSQFKKPNTDMSVPEFIKQGTKEIRGAFLAGLLDADGCVLNKPIRVLNSVYSNLTKDVQNLYSSLGIPVRMKFSERKEKNWKAIGQLNLVGKTATEKFKLFVEPYSVKKIVKDNNFGQYDYTIPSSLIRGNVDRSMDRIVEDPKFLPIKIYSIEEGNLVDTYDIEVQERNEFVCEGLLVHNSAMISFFDANDEDMITCKYGNWWELNEQRGRSNNSSVLQRGQISKEQFFSLWDRIESSGSGEPGVYWTNDKEVLSNPCCFVGSTKILTHEGYQEIKDCEGELLLINKEGKVVNGLVWSNGEKDVIELRLSNKTKIKCTPDHRFMLTDGSECEAQNSIGKRIMPFLSTAEKINQNLEKLIIDKDTEVLDVVFIGKEEVFDFSLDDDTHWGVIEGLIAHNCEIALRPYSFCNLCEINASSIESQEDYNKRTEIAAFFGTLQAGLTDFHYLRPIWKQTTEEDALLGIGMTGIASNIVTSLDMKEAAQKSIEENKRVSAVIGINSAARIGCIKPSGCQVKDTLLSTNEGILTLDEIGDINGETWQDHDIEILQKNNYAKSTKFYVNGHSFTKKIIMDSGIFLESTYNHKYQVLVGDQLVWKKAEDICVGDIIPYKVGGYDKKQHVSLVNTKERNTSNIKHITQPTVLSKDLAWLLGLYFGNGSTHKKGIRIAGDANKRQILERAAEIASKEFNIKGIIYERYRGANNADLYLNSTELLDFLAANNLIKQKSTNIEFPKIIRTASKEVLEYFIDGYAHADGSFKTRELTFCTTSEKWAQQLVIILRFLGKDAKMRKMPPTATSLGQNMRYWVSVRKGRNAQKSKIKNSKKEIWEKLDKLELHDFSFDIVASTTDSYNETFDIEVPQDNYYIANNYISHNTTSNVLGTSSGIHAWHSQYYLRTMRFGTNEAIVKYLQEVVPELIEPDVLRPHDTVCFRVPVKATPGGILREHETAISLLERVKHIKQNWIDSTHNRGTNTHNVSVTVSIKENEWEEVGNWMWENKEYYNGIAVLPYWGGTYKQAPFEEITEQQYNEWCTKINSLDMSKIIEEDDNVEYNQIAACAGGQCEL